MPGVNRLDESAALVQTVDFFTPIVDDPFVYGQIAAANALSDVYAMGGRRSPRSRSPRFRRTRDTDRFWRRSSAAASTSCPKPAWRCSAATPCRAAEIKFGYAITGDVLTAKVWSNAGARPGDELLPTKALGTGIIATALKFERAPAEAVAAAIRSMTTLNRVAAEALQLAADAVHACTDVTGFGLIGHASEMAAASRCTLEIDAAAVPLLPGAGLVQGTPGGGRTNAQHFGRRGPNPPTSIPSWCSSASTRRHPAGCSSPSTRWRAGRRERPARRRRTGGPDRPGPPADGRAGQVR